MKEGEKIIVLCVFSNRPNRQNRQKVTLEEGVSVESAFNMQCYIGKNTLLRTASVGRVHYTQYKLKIKLVLLGYDIFVL